MCGVSGMTRWRRGLMDRTEIAAAQPESVAPGRTAFINRHRREALPADLRLGFFHYDWTINRQAPRHAAG